MTKEKFMEMYVASFLGAWANSVTWEGRPNWQRIVCDPPIEDAIFQAEETWKRGRKVAPEFFERHVVRDEHGGVYIDGNYTSKEALDQIAKWTNTEMSEETRKAIFEGLA